MTRFSLLYLYIWKIVGGRRSLTCYEVKQSKWKD